MTDKERRLTHTLLITHIVLSLYLVVIETVTLITHVGHLI